MKSTKRRSLVALATFGVALFVGIGIAQEPAPVTSPSASMMANQKAMGDMMARGQQMMADMHATDQKLNELVAAMNATRGNEGLDAVVAVVNELVARQQTTRDMMASMMSMHSMMMGSGSMPGMKPKDK